MAKRILPLFVVDHCRMHRFGECDFIACTAKDNGFIAKVDHVEGDITEIGDDYRIGGARNGISCRIQILRYTGSNIDKAEIRTLLKAALEYHSECTRCPVNVDAPSIDDCTNFLMLLVRSNMHHLAEAKSDFNARQTVLTSLTMLEATIEHLKRLKP
jgi:hypothetical protein